MTDCCELLPLVMGRCATSARPIGIVRETLISLNGSERQAIVVHFPRARTGPRGAKFANASYAELSFCPFCGTKLRAEPRKPRKVKRA